jgi:hypothetical protein
VVDLAAMRDAMVAMGGDPDKINPLSPAVTPRAPGRGVLRCRIDKDDKIGHGSGRPTVQPPGDCRKIAGLQITFRRP